MGLGILEQVFTEEQSQAKSELVNQDRTAKRRRTESTLLNASTPDEDTDCADTMYYAGSKTKGGVGYGGRVVEDVRDFLSRLSLSSVHVLAFGSSTCASCAKEERRAHRKTHVRDTRILAFTASSWWRYECSAPRCHGHSTDTQM